MRILFISRAYPPIIGGIENQNRDLALWLGKKTRLTLIANTRGKSFLPIFLPYALLKGIFLSFSNDIVIVGDGVLAPLAACISFLRPGIRSTAVVHGLDLTYGSKSDSILSRTYRAINIPTLRRLDMIFAVSSFTRMRAMAAGIDPDRIVVIPNGIDPTELVRLRDRASLDGLVGTDTDNRFVILRIGRYVKHKGVEWFIRNVVPLLPEQVLFVAAGAIVGKHTTGDADYFPACQRAVKELGLSDKVRLLTDLSRSDILTLLNASDLAVSPNIPVPGTMEGFGINVIEANACGLPVIASDLEGLTEAVIDGENGHLVQPGDAEGFAVQIRALMDDRARLSAEQRAASDFSARAFGWDSLSDKYVESLRALMSS